MNAIVCYHYIRDNTNFKAFSTTQFREQIEAIQKKYKIVSLNDFLTQRFNVDTCTLTFDDGIKDGYTNALPILKEFGIEATFFIPTSILITHLLLGAQKRHLLLSELGTEKFVEEFNSRVDDKIVDKGRMDEYFYDDGLTAALKNRLDTGGEEVMEEIFKKHFNEEEEFNKMYLNAEDIRSMKAWGQKFGSHSHNHVWLGRLSGEEVRKELETSMETVKDFFPEQLPVVSYPFGSYNKNVMKIAKKVGFKAGMSINKHLNNGSNPMVLGRFDCVQPMEEWK